MWWVIFLAANGSKGVRRCETGWRVGCGAKLPVAVLLVARHETSSLWDEGEGEVESSSFLVLEFLMRSTAWLFRGVSAFQEVVTERLQLYF